MATIFLHIINVKLYTLVEILTFKIPRGGGGQPDKKVLPCADLALNFIPFSRITMSGQNIPFSRIFKREFSE